MQNNETFGSLMMSSKDPSKISLTVKGLLLQIVPVFLLVTHAYGIDTVDEGGLTTLIEVATNGLAALIEGVSLVMVAWGLVRKMFLPIE